MKNLSDVFALASRLKRDRLSADTDALVHRINDAVSGRIDWDLGAGENWASIIVGDDLAAYVYALAPLILCLDPYAPAVQSHSRSGTCVVVVSDIDSEELCASEESLLALFGRDFAEREDLVPEHFAASDLWFSTI